MLRFLFTPRWLALLVAVIGIGVACIFLGRWQFHRYDDRVATNAQTEQNLAENPEPVAGVMRPGQPLAVEHEWSHVTMTGHYDTPRQLAVLYRTRDSASGVDQVVPFVTTDGTAVLVDRGWVEGPSNAQIPRMPAPPRGTVTVEGWTRVSADSTGNDVTPSQGSVRAISSSAIAPTLPYPVLGGFVDLVKEQPAPRHAPAKPPPPDLGTGPHFFYGIQWWFFAALALGFWVYFARAEYVETKKKVAAERQERPAVTDRV